MPNNASTIKRLRQTKTRTERNKSRKSKISTLEKKFRAQVEAKDLETAAVTLRKTIAGYDKAAKIGLIHQNKVSRKKSQLNRVLSQAAG